MGIETRRFRELVNHNQDDHATIRHRRIHDEIHQELGQEKSGTRRPSKDLGTDVQSLEILAGCTGDKSAMSFTHSTP